MVNVWFVPINTQLRDADVDDYVLTPTDASGEYLVGRFSGHGTGEGIRWVGRIQNSELSGSAREMSAAEPVRLDDDSVLEAVQAAERSGLSA
jgi:hypothetical protein